MTISGSARLGDDERAAGSTAVQFRADNMEAFIVGYRPEVVVRKLSAAKLESLPQTDHETLRQGS